MYRARLFEGGALKTDINPAVPPTGINNIVYDREDGVGEEKSLVLVDQQLFIMSQRRAIRIPDPGLEYPIVRSAEDEIPYVANFTTHMLVFRYDELPPEVRTVYTKRFWRDDGLRTRFDPEIITSLDDQDPSGPVPMSPNGLVVLITKMSDGVPSSNRYTINQFVNGIEVVDALTSGGAIANPDTVLEVPWDFHPGSEVEWYAFAYWDRGLSAEEIGILSAEFLGDVSVPVTGFYVDGYVDAY
jgi:hypothetical protein